MINLPGGYMPDTLPEHGDGGDLIRASNIGKPAIELAAIKFGATDGKPQFSEQTHLILHLGECFESWLHNFLLRSGYSIHSTQQTHSLYGVVGHSDFIVSDPKGYKFVVDAKAVNERCFKNYQRRGLLDDRGYASQLTVYCSDVNLPGCVVALNKNTGEIDHFWLTMQQRIDLAERVKKIMEVFRSVSSFEECFKHFQPPWPKPEVHKKEFTGRLLPPFNINKALLHKIYELYEDTNARGETKLYVRDFIYPEGYEEFKPNIEEAFYG